MRIIKLDRKKVETGKKIIFIIAWILIARISLPILFSIGLYLGSMIRFLYEILGREAYALFQIF